MKKSLLIAGFIIMSGTLLITSSCSKKDDATTNTTTPTVTLYTKVGGTTLVNDPAHAGQMIEQGRLTLRAVVDSSIFVIAADTNLQKYFPVLFAELGASNTTGLVALSKNFTDFMCYATGSKNTSYTYSGKSMHDAHDPAINTRMGLKVDAADFDRFVGDIGVGLAQNGVNSTNNKALVDELVALLYTTKAAIVQR